MDGRVTTLYKDRWQAGLQLASHLTAYADRNDVVVLGLPRGGVLVGAAVASRLDVPLRAFVVRKLGVPWQSELAFGAIASGGIVVVDEHTLRATGLDDSAVQAVIIREQHELNRKESIYKPALRQEDLRRKVVIVVDDGIATGSSMLAAVRAIATCKPQTIVVAVPVSSMSALEQLRNEVQEVVCPLHPHSFRGVGEFYLDFTPVTDEEVQRLLSAHEHVSYHYACE